jgi:hypothetical protein
MVYDDRESSLQGADYSHLATVYVNQSDPLVKAYMTWKVNRSDADPGVLQKTVTVTNSAGVGQIVDDGSTDGVALVRFDITAAQSAALSPQDYQWDIKIKTAGTALAYAAGGIWHFWQNTTDSI